jgi:diguanylate cyclase (GGDEF)-like protein
LTWTELIGIVPQTTGPLSARSMTSDKRKLVFILSILLSAGFAATTLINYYVSKASIRESIVDSELPLTSDNIYSEIQKDLVRPIVISSMMASDTFLRDWVLAGEQDVEKMTRYLREVKDRYGAFTSFFISEGSRIYYQTEGVLKLVRQDEPRDAWYFRVREMNPAYEINMDPDLANKDALTIFINYRVFDYDGKFIGAAGVGLTVGAVRALINDYQTRYQRSIYFVDRKGGIALFSNESPAAAAASIHNIEGLGKIAKKILHKGAGTFQYGNAAGNHLLNVRFIPELNWYLFVERLEDEALEDIRTTLYLNLVICLIITVITLLATSLTINRYQARLEKMATTDKLTGLANRHAFDLVMPHIISEARRDRKPLLAVLIDIDHFKKINDRLGHLAGDGVIREIAGTIKAAVRKSDLVCRWGGEEFLLLLRGTDADRGQLLAEKIRGAVAAASLRHGDAEIAVTISLGVAAYVDGDTPDQLIARADGALYDAKRKGRNVVRAAAPHEGDTARIRT